MAIKYIKTYYGCDFKCGKHHSQKEKHIQEHEQTCWFNPINRTCKTCKHEDYYIDDNGVDIMDWNYATWRDRDCKGDGGNLMETLHELLDENKISYVPPIINCPFWENDEYPNSKLKDGLPVFPSCVKQSIPDEEIPF